MTENKIKSEKASKYINYHCIDIDTIYPLTNDQVEEVVIIAETELTEAHAKELQTMQTAIDEGKARETIAAKILADKRKEGERLEKELQKLIEVHNVDRYHMENNHQIELQQLKEKAIESFKDIMFDAMMESRDGKFIPEDYCLTKFLTELNK